MNLSLKQEHPVKSGCFFYQCQLILLGVVGAFISSFLFAFLRPYVMHQSISTTQYYPTLGSILIAVFISPLIEETLFRNGLIPFLKKKGWRYRYAILTSAFLFACLHFDWWIFPYFVNGIIYGVVKVKSKNNYSSIIVHSLYNLFVLFPLIFKLV